MSYSRWRRPVLYTFLPIAIFPKIKHNFFGRRAVLEGGVQEFYPILFYSNVLKSPLLDRHVLRVSKLVLTRWWWEGVCPHAADGAVAHKLRWYQITVHLGVGVLGGWGKPNFTQPRFPTGSRAKVQGLSQFHREIGVVTVSLFSEGDMKRTTICFLTALFRLCCLVFVSFISNLRAKFFSLYKKYTPS